MKQLLLFLAILILATSISFAQTRPVARGAEPGELYYAGIWYGVYGPMGPPSYDTLRNAVYRLTENGKKLTIQYDYDEFADLYTEPGFVAPTQWILADATPGVLYARNTYSKNNYTHTSLWASFDYGENWIFKEENGGSKDYFSANVEGLVYRAASAGTAIGTYRSYDYAETFTIIDHRKFNTNEPGFDECEFFTLNGRRFYHTYDCFQNYITLTIDEEYAFGNQVNGVLSDIFRGGLPGEVYITSWFPDDTYKVSFSADTGRTFRHVYIFERDHSSSRLFMSDREPGVFYILRLSRVHDFSPWGHHHNLCIEYYRDYGETLEAVFCHDIHKNYVYEEVICDNVTYLEPATVYFNSIQLQWANSVDDEFIRGYHVYRNNTRITSQLLTHAFYLDENLPAGDYEYYVRTYYQEGCVSDSSNRVMGTILTCEAVNDLASEKPTENSVLLTWSAPEEDLEVEGYSVYRNGILLTVELILNTSYLDENLPTGDYEYYVLTYYTNGCLSAASNKVEESIDLGVREVNELERITVYPNPTTGELRITSYELRIEGIEVFDVYGRNVLSSMSQSPQQHSLNISHLQSGVYFVRVTTEKGMIMRKVVKH